MKQRHQEAFVKVEIKVRVKGNDIHSQIRSHSNNHVKLFQSISYVYFRIPIVSHSGLDTDNFIMRLLDQMQSELKRLLISKF